MPAGILRSFGKAAELFSVNLKAFSIHLSHVRPQVANKSVYDRILHMRPYRGTSRSGEYGPSSPRWLSILLRSATALVASSTTIALVSEHLCSEDSDPGMLRLASHLSLVCACHSDTSKSKGAAPIRPKPVLAHQHCRKEGAGLGDKLSVKGVAVQGTAGAVAGIAGGLAVGWATAPFMSVFGSLVPAVAVALQPVILPATALASAGLCIGAAAEAVFGSCCNPSSCACTCPGCTAARASLLSTSTMESDDFKRRLEDWENDLINRVQANQADQVINTATRQPLPAGKKFHAFLSHNHGDDVHGRDNHKHVARIAEELRKRGLKVWFDDDNLGERPIEVELRDGIESSAVFVCFITQVYCDKVGKGSAKPSYAKYEFECVFYRRDLLNAIGDMRLAVPMETSMTDPVAWNKTVRDELAMYMFRAAFSPLQEVNSEEKFKAQVDLLYAQICRKCELLDAQRQAP